MVTPLQATRLAVQVVCLGNGMGFVKDMLVPNGQTAGWCVNASGLYARHPELREGAFLAIWGTKVPPETVLADGDRVEVLLPVDPAAQARVRRAKQTG